MTTAEAILPDDIRKIKSTFKGGDTNGDGFITKAELKALFQDLGNWSSEDFDRLYSAVDRSGDGRINYEEFLDWLMAEGNNKPAHQGHANVLAQLMFDLEAATEADVVKALSALDADARQKLVTALGDSEPTPQGNADLLSQLIADLEVATEADVVKALSALDDVARQKLLTALGERETAPQGQADVLSQLIADLEVATEADVVKALSALDDDARRKLLTAVGVGFPK